MTKELNMGPKGGNRDVVDALNGIFDIRDLETKLRRDKETYGLSDDEIDALRGAYLREQRGSLENAVHQAMAWGLEVIGASPPQERNSQEIINEAIRRRK